MRGEGNTTQPRPIELPQAASCGSYRPVCGKVRPPCTEKMATCKCCTRIHASCDTVAFQADVDIRLSAQADSLLICELDEFGVGDIFRSFAETL